MPCPWIAIAVIATVLLLLRYRENAFMPNSAYIIDVIVTEMTVVMLITMIHREVKV
jgi:hypothetical protein